jgi:hypothetical protein
MTRGDTYDWRKCEARLKAGVQDAGPQVIELGLGSHGDRERPDRFCSGDGHVDLLGWCGLIGR